MNIIAQYCRAAKVAVEAMEGTARGGMVKADTVEVVVILVSNQ